MLSCNIDFMRAAAERPDGVFSLLGDGDLLDFQVFGERSSGTNVLEYLIAENTDLVRVQNYGWKHGFPVALAYHPSSLIVLVVRHPIDWAISMFNNPHAAHADVNTTDFSAFIRNEWAMIVRPRVNMFWKKPWQMTVRQDVGGQECMFDRNPATGLRFRNIMEMRYAKMQAMLTMRNRQTNFCLVKFEDVLKAPSPFIRRVREISGTPTALDLQDLPTQPLNPKRSRPKTRVARSNISDEDYDFIVSQCDKTIETALGYTLQRQ